MHMLSHAQGPDVYFYICVILHLLILVPLTRQYPGWWRVVD